MSYQRGPRNGSRAFCALERLHAIGRPVRIGDWMKVLCWVGTASRFQHDVIDVLVRARLIECDGAECVTTASVLKFLGLDADDAAPITPLVVAGPRYHAGIKPLDVARHCPSPLVREGGGAYRDIPSLIGSNRVAYGAP